MVSARSTVKRALAALPSRAATTGMTALIYHRVGGSSGDELDLPLDDFTRQLAVLTEERGRVLSLDAALDRLALGDDAPSVVLTFDDGFGDVHRNAWPVLRDLQLPFTLYLAAGLVGGEMRWEGSAAASQGSAALDWDQVGEMRSSGLCTVGNHTWDHAGPHAVDSAQLDQCSAEIERRLGARPTHFAWTWGVAVPSLLPAVRERFRSAATGVIGRNVVGTDPHALRRVPVRASDPLPFFRAKITGGLGPERTYASMAHAAKHLRRRVRP